MSSGFADQNPHTKRARPDYGCGDAFCSALPDGIRSGLHRVSDINDIKSPDGPKIGGSSGKNKAGAEINPERQGR
tara:strand:+ start:402 stop:626 length:225 start_codon:yes stop_codon:yes gene_type:complete